MLKIDKIHSKFKISLFSLIDRKLGEQRKKINSIHLFNKLVTGIIILKVYLLFIKQLVK